jgi:formate dehydrogenase subunit gamma
MEARKNHAHSEVHRFSLAERLVHWLVGLTFVLLLLTGLAFSYPPLFWLTVLLGGGPTARVLHPWIGVLFTGGVVAMFWIWMRDMFISRSDVVWLKAVRHYARHDKENVPPAGKYNGGQKIFFWVQSMLGVVFLLSGLVLWFPDSSGSTTLATMRFLHYAGALGAGLLLIPHIYLGTVAFPGTLRGMLHGKVSHGWARTHHPDWQRDRAEE